MCAQLPFMSNCQPWNMQVMCLGAPEAVPSLKLPEGRFSMVLPRCGHTLRNARTWPSGPRATMIGSLAMVVVRKS